MSEWRPVTDYATVKVEVEPSHDMTLTGDKVWSTLGAIGVFVSAKHNYDGQYLTVETAIVEHNLPAEV